MSTVLDPGKHTFEEFQFEDFSSGSGMIHFACISCAPSGDTAICGKRINPETLTDAGDPVDCVVCADLVGPFVRCPTCGQR